MTRITLSFKCFAVVVLLLTVSVFAARGVAVPEYSCRKWQTDDGLPNNTVLALCQTDERYLWVGTRNGLARFDGVRFTLFNQKNAPELNGSWIHFLCQANGGALWIETGKALTSFKDGHFTCVSLRDKSPGNSLIRSQLLTRDGVFWVGSENGLVGYKDGKRTFLGKAEGLLDGTVLAICDDAEGNLWIGTGTGLMRYKDGKLTAIPMEGGNAYVTAVKAIRCDKDGNLWIGTNGGGLARLKNGQFQYFRQSDGLPDNSITTILEDSRGQLWVGTMSGLCRRIGDAFVQALQSDESSFDSVFSMIEDAEGNLWVGTKEGLTQLRFKPFKSYTKRQGLSHNNCTSLYEDPEGAIWITTWGGGVSVFKDGTFTTYNSKNSGISDLLLSVGRRRDGSLWFGSDHAGGLFRLKDGRFTHYGKEQGILDPALRVLFEDHNGDLWIGSSSSLYQMHNETIRRFTMEDGLPDRMIRTLYEDRNGTLWIGTHQGLSKFVDGKFINFTVNDGLSDDAILAIYEDAQGTFWIGTEKGGLNRWKDGVFTSYTPAQGLFDAQVASIMEDDHETLWLSSFSGVFRVSKHDLNEYACGSIHQISCASFGKIDGMSSVQCNGVANPSACKTRDGRLWYPTTRGVVVVDPNSLRQSSEVPPVKIERIMADRHAVYNSVSTNGQPSAAEIRVSPGRGELEFSYTALSFSTPEKNRFKYQLEGVDHDWIDGQNQHTVTYNNILPGHYTFRVIACNDDGVWNENGTSLSFYLEPHFYQTYWFYGALTVLIGLAIVATHGFRVRHLQAGKRKLQELVEDRTRELETAHRQLLETSRRAGMAEVATNILHNVGNVLNSANVSANLLQDYVRDSEAEGVAKVAKLVQEHSADLPSFFSNGRGKHLPGYMLTLAEQLHGQKKMMANEVQLLCQQIDHIKTIVAMQQSYATIAAVTETVNLVEVTEDALRMNAAAFERHDVAVVREYSTVRPVVTEKHKVLQILINLLRNAKQACDEGNPPNKQITLRVFDDSCSVIVQVVDNGVGIPPENLGKLFAQGFTTRKEGHGFGLHSGALAARELQGSLTVHSDGRDRGACFALKLPYQLNGHETKQHLQ